MPKNCRSSILVLTVWILCVLSIFALYTSHAVQQRVLIVSRIEDNEDLYRIAEAGVKKAILILKKTRPGERFMALSQECTNNKASFKDVIVGRGYFNVSYQGETVEEYGFIDEEGKLNLNTAPAETIKRLLQIAAGLDESPAWGIANFIVDYRDQDKFTAEGIPEDFAWRGYDHKIKDLPLESIEEMNLCPEMTRKIFREISPYVTVYGSGKVNINSAPAEVLLALVPDEALVKKMVSFRAGIDNVEGNDDDFVVREGVRYLDEISRSLALTQNDLDKLNVLLSSGIISTSSGSVFIESKAFLKGKNKSLRVACVYDLGKGICYWRQRYRSE